MFKIGDHVFHSGHGHGRVVGYNQRPGNRYLEERGPAKVLELSKGAEKIVIRAITSSLYDGERYPYVVKFDDGYQDVYAETELDKRR